jgi:hypothetical protein
MTAVRSGRGGRCVDTQPRGIHRHDAVASRRDLARARWPAVPVDTLMTVTLPPPGRTCCNAVDNVRMSPPPSATANGYHSTKVHTVAGLLSGLDPESLDCGYAVGAPRGPPDIIPRGSSSPGRHHRHRGGPPAEFRAINQSVAPVRNRGGRDSVARASATQGLDACSGYLPPLHSLFGGSNSTKNPRKLGKTDVPASLSWPAHPGRGGICAASQQRGRQYRVPRARACGRSPGAASEEQFDPGPPAAPRCCAAVSEPITLRQLSPVSRWRQRPRASATKL